MDSPEPVVNEPVILVDRTSSPEPENFEEPHCTSFMGMMTDFASFLKHPFSFHRNMSRSNDLTRETQPDGAEWEASGVENATLLKAESLTMRSSFDGVGKEPIRNEGSKRRRVLVPILVGLLSFVLGIIIGAYGTGKGRQARTAALSTDANGNGCTCVPGAPAPAPTGGGFVTPVDSDSVFGPNVIIIDQSWTTEEIQSTANALFNQQQNDEMGTNRYSLYFMPGTYGTVEQPLMLQIGYYTEVAGLGTTPNDVQIYGKIEVYNRCFEADPYAEGKFIPTTNSEQGLCFALNSFWRSLANLSINIVSVNQDECRAQANFWAISQASSMRRVNIQGGTLSLMDYCSNPAYASGGFIADTRAEKIVSGSQQQFFTRNSEVSEWDGGVWNQMFLGVAGAPDGSNFPDEPFTTFDQNPLSREKPFIFLDDSTGQFYVQVPRVASATSGVSWSSGVLEGTALSVNDECFVAKPTDAVSTINSAIANGKHIIFSPGVYSISESIIVDQPGTVILGMGLATLTAVDGCVPLKVADVPGVIVAGMTIDAGEVQSPVLLQVGYSDVAATQADTSSNPITLSDVYFRLGGPHVGKADVCLEVNSNNVLIDHTWVWRADHGVEPFDTTNGFDGDNERWVTNIGLNGVVVNGDNVTATGLFVEHYQQYNLVWNGDGGRVFFYQNELPYEPPTQADWTADDGTLGWAGYKVSDSVTSHELWGGGVYCYNRNNPDVVTMNGFEAPQTSGVRLNRVYTRNLSGPGTILSVVNGVGTTVDSVNPGPEYVVQYPL